MPDHKPIILINLCTKEGDDMFYIKRGYLEALMNAGGIPVTLPLLADRDYASRVVDIADGILLPGSITDVDPKHYNDQMSPWFGQKGPERDASDFYLLEKAAERKLPVFGICFGHQSVNVFNGGSLYQDLPHDVGPGINHWQAEPYHLPVHRVRLEQNSIVHRIFGATEIDVNSIHHQGVKTLAPTLRATAFSDDGVVEAYESRNGGQFLMGVQWHPERMWRHDENQAALFFEFIKAAKDWHQRNR